MNKTLTRKQIQAYGASKYQAQVITKELVSIDRYGRVHLYNLNDVVIAIRQYVQRSRIKQYTRETLNSALLALLAKRKDSGAGSYIQRDFHFTKLV